MRILNCLIMAAAVLGYVGAAHANLVTNGSFESGTNDPTNTTIATSINGWDINDGDGVERFQPGVGPYAALGPADDGAWVVDLSYFTSGNGIITQDLATTSGGLYNLTFALGNSNAFGRTGTGTVDVLVDGALLANALLTPVATSADIVWQDFTLQFTAATPPTKIEFRNGVATQNGFLYFAFLDDVRVTAVPEVGAWALCSLVGLAAGGRTWLGRRKTA